MSSLAEAAKKHVEKAKSAAPHFPVDAGTGALAESKGPNEVILFFANIQRKWEEDVKSFFTLGSKNNGEEKSGTPEDALEAAAEAAEDSLSTFQVATTTYIYSNDSDSTTPVGVRTLPKLSSAKTGMVIRPGEKFEVVKVITKEGVNFAVLPGVRFGSLCARSTCCENSFAAA